MNIPLIKLPKDIRDFSHHKIYGTTAPEKIPDIDFIVSRVQPVILDQSNTPDCPGFSTSEINSHMQAVEPPDYFDPFYQMAKILQIQGDPNAIGADLRSASQSLIQYGSLLHSRCPYTYNQGLPTDRDLAFLNDYRNWLPILDTYAARYKLGSYFIVDGPGDDFDNIRSVLYKNCTVVSNQLYSGVLFGLNWRPEWTYAQGGIINDNYTVSDGGGHAVLILGQKMINSIPYIIVQNSWSKSFGDNGLYYFPRNVINIEAAQNFGMFTFSNLPAQDARYMLQYGIMHGDPWVLEMFSIMVGIIKNIISKI